MNIRQLNKKKVPIAAIDESLDKYNEIVLFPEKLKQANQTLKRTNLPARSSSKQIAAEPSTKYRKK